MDFAHMRIQQSLAGILVESLSNELRTVVMLTMAFAVYAALALAGRCLDLGLLVLGNGVVRDNWRFDAAQPFRRIEDLKAEKRNREMLVILFSGRFGLAFPVVHPPWIHMTGDLTVAAEPKRPSDDSRRYLRTNWISSWYINIPLDSPNGHLGSVGMVRSPVRRIHGGATYE